jgi:hypothetical protein
LEGSDRGLVGVPSRHLPGGTVEIHGNLSEDGWVHRRNSNRAPPDTRIRVYSVSVTPVISVPAYSNITSHIISPHRGVTWHVTKSFLSAINQPTIREILIKYFIYIPLCIILNCDVQFGEYVSSVLIQP